MEPINANAQYMKVLSNNGQFILIDMNDIARIGIGGKINITDYGNYNDAIIDWKTPYTDQWRVFIDDDGLKLWNKFCEKSQKSVDKV